MPFVVYHIIVREQMDQVTLGKVAVPFLNQIAAP